MDIGAGGEEPRRGRADDDDADRAVFFERRQRTVEVGEHGAVHGVEPWRIVDRQARDIAFDCEPDAASGGPLLSTKPHLPLPPASPLPRPVL